MPPAATADYSLLATGDEAFSRMLEAIEAARRFVRLEMYIFEASPIGERFRSALIEAARRGVQVRVLVDSFGSILLLDSFWGPLRQAGGEMRWFNPLSLRRFNIRNHRKLLVCDDRVAFIGGFNIAPAWEGDGVERGWRDLGLVVTGPVVEELSVSFDEMFMRADFQHKRFIRLRRRPLAGVPMSRAELMLSGPGRGRSPIKLALRRDLAHAHDVRIIAAYFLPPRKLRRALLHVMRRGGRVQLILPAKSDVPLIQLAVRSLYQRMLRFGIELYEYQPQILHAKLIVIDDVVYLGSSNLDTRSFNINYELMLRLVDPQLAAPAREIFARDLERSRRIDRGAWRKSRTFWNKLKERWAYLFFTRFDPYVARRQFEAMD
jgi:cardiolipin synthase